MFSKKLLASVLLLSGFCFAQGGTTSSNILPSNPGQYLGAVGQEWNIYALNLDVLGTLTCNGGSCFTANYLADPGSNGLLKRTALNTTAVASAGTDYMTPSTAVVASQMPALTGDVTTTSGAVATTLAAKYKIRPCEIHIWGDGTGGVLQDTNDEPASCYNSYGANLTITAVRCRADAGTPYIAPVITGGGYLLSGPTGTLGCGTGSFTMGGLNGTPVQTSGSTLDINITTSGGAAHSIVVIIERTL